MRTLGAFSVERDGARLEFRSKAQKRPLEMLKGVVAAGGRDVPEEQIADALWPDADGDAAHRAFATTLHRLRRLLACDEALVLTEGRLRIDRRVCWVDALAFDDLTGRAEEAGRSGDGRGNERERHLLQSALALYRGPFLADVAGASWPIAMRERLRARFLRASARLARLLEEGDEIDAAIACYEDALAVDDLSEGVYQSLIRCCHRAGRRADVAAVFERCRRTLIGVLGVEPSPATRALLEELVATSVPDP